MSFATTLVQFSLPMLSFADLVRGALMLALLASLLMFFRPLLLGIMRATLLAVRARRPRKDAARRGGMDGVPGQRV
ncbi:MAG: hypothetical protein V7631_2647 [Massilia sp.]|jgi:hypothetical protein